MNAAQRKELGDSDGDFRSDLSYSDDRAGAGIMEADDRQVTIIFTV